MIVNYYKDWESMREIVKMEMKLRREEGEGER